MNEAVFLAEDEFDPSELTVRQAERLLEAHATPKRLRALLDQVAGFDWDLWRGVTELGLVAASLPEDIGGFGLGWPVLGELARIGGRYTASLPLVAGVVGAHALRRHDTALAQQIGAGEVMVALALGEPGADSASLPEFRAGALNGTLPNCPFAGVADLMILAAREGDRTVLARVRLENIGVSRNSAGMIDNARGAATVVFEHAEAVVIGESDDLERTRLAAAAATAFEQVGGAERCLELSCEYARERRAFGQPIGSFQAVKHKLADFYTAIELARGCANAAFSHLESGSDDLRMSAAAARIAASDAYEFAATETIQVFGAIGVTWEAPAHHHYSRARVLAVELGSRIAWRNLLVTTLVERPTSVTKPPSAFEQSVDRGGIEAYFARAREWLAANAPAHELRCGETVAEKLALGRRWQALKAANGYSAITLPELYGGGGGSDLERIVFAEEELRYDLPTVFFGVSLNIVIPIFNIYGPDEAKSKLIPPAIRGDQIWCQLFSEPSAGSDLAGLRLSAVRDGDGWRLNGQKVWTSWAQFSDWGYIATRTDPSRPKHKGLTCFFVDMKSPGVEVRPIRKIGCDQEINEVFFDDVYVPDDQRLGEVNDGFKVMMHTLMIERYALNDAFAGGPGIDRFLALAANAKVGGRPAVEDGEVRRTIVTSYISWLGQQSIYERAMASMARGAEPGPEGSIRKLLAAKARQSLSTMALDLLGPAGLELDPRLSERHDFAQSWIDAPQLRIAGGTDDILRNTIAEKILRLPQDYRPDKGVPFNTN